MIPRVYRCARPNHDHIVVEIKGQVVLLTSLYSEAWDFISQGFGETTLPLITGRHRPISVKKDEVQSLDLVLDELLGSEEDLV